MLNKILAYEWMTPTQAKTQLQTDMQAPEFRKVAMATFNDAKYFLKPAKFEEFLAKKWNGTLAETGQPITTCWTGWDVLDRMAGGFLTGDAAKQVLADQYALLDPDARQVVLRVLDKTWRNGVTQTIINEAIPGTFRPVKLMLAHKLKDRVAHDEKQVAKGKPPTLQWPMLATFKYDGFRGAFHHGDQACYSRQGNKFPLTEGLQDALAKLGHWLGVNYDKDAPLALDGELFAGSWKATAEARADGYDHMVVFSTMFDDNIYGEGELLNLHVQDFFDDVQTFAVRNHLTRYLSVPKCRVVGDMGEVNQFFTEAIYENYEGLIVRPMDHVWESKRSYHWLKVKAEETEDLVITGWEMSEERSRNAGLIGSILVDREGVESGASGMSDDLRKRLTEMGDEIIGLIAEIQYHELTPDGKLRHAVIKKIRFDKGVE